MRPQLRWPLWGLGILAGLLLTGVVIAAVAAALVIPRLPDLTAIKDYRPKIPLRVYTADGYLIGEFGEERRDVVRIHNVPENLKNAILAAEDDRFYQHGGVDYVGVLRALLANMRGGARQGASTITMQVARNFYLSADRTYLRKLYEVFLAYKIEHALSKDEILEVYINQIFLGRRAYGFAAAARTYFGKPLAELSLAQLAMLAGLPKAPSDYNPVVNPQRAKIRQEYVLQRMHHLGYITDAQWEQARKEPIQTVSSGGMQQASAIEGHAAHVAEMARQIAVERFHEAAYTDGLRVITTLLHDQQEAAYAALRSGIMTFDRRHGYRGARAFVALDKVKDNDAEALSDLLSDYRDSDDLLAAIVLDATPSQVRVWLRQNEIITLSGEGLSFAAPMLRASAPPAKRIRRGAIVYVQKTEKSWRITQLPDVEAAFVAASPTDGAVRALVGGFDFGLSNFNHVTQAWRQPGSSFKPFVYSAALEKGFNPGSIIEDAPIVLGSDQTGSQTWEPKNYDGRYDGPITMREALVRSKNMVSIRLMQASGAKYTQDYVTRFGFDADKNPAYLTLALGAGAVTPWQQVGAYAVFANGGYRIKPYIVSQILNAQGDVLAEIKPDVAGDEALRVIDVRNAWMLDSMMRDVVARGTAARAGKTLQRRDLAGKTGTTNDYIDAWFCGYQPSTVVAVAWIGYDQPRRMGSGETGGVAALPIWIDFMKKTLKGVPEFFITRPDGLTGDAGTPEYEENQGLPATTLPEEAPDFERLVMPTLPSKIDWKQILNAPAVENAAAPSAPTPAPGAAPGAAPAAPPPSAKTAPLPLPATASEWR